MGTLFHHSDDASSTLTALYDECQHHAQTRPYFLVEIYDAISHALLISFHIPISIARIRFPDVEPGTRHKQVAVDFQSAEMAGGAAAAGGAAGGAAVSAAVSAAEIHACTKVLFDALVYCSVPMAAASKSTVRITRLCLEALRPHRMSFFIKAFAAYDRKMRAF